MWCAVSRSVTALSTQDSGVARFIAPPRTAPWPCGRSWRGLPPQLFLGWVQVYPWPRLAVPCAAASLTDQLPASRPQTTPALIGQRVGDEPLIAKRPGSSAGSAIEFRDGVGWRTRTHWPLPVRREQERASSRSLRNLRSRRHLYFHAGNLPPQLIRGVAKRLPSPIRPGLPHRLNQQPKRCTPAGLIALNDPQDGRAVIIGHVVGGTVPPAVVR